MEKLENFYSAVGGNCAEVVHRLGGDAGMVKMFLLKFKSDKTFEGLKTALSENNCADAFRSAHTLKGICANLGLENLFNEAFAITEMLRGGDIESAKHAFLTVEHEYNLVLSALEKLGA